MRQSRNKGRGRLIVGVLFAGFLVLLSTASAERWLIRGETGNPLEGLTVCLDSVCTENATDENGIVEVEAKANTWYTLRLLFGNNLYFSDDLFVTTPMAFDGVVVKIESLDSP